MRDTTIYALHLKNGPIRYVGKTIQTMEKRMRSHRAAKRKKAPVNCWFAKHDKDILFTILEVVPFEENWANREKFWIAHYRQHNILNIMNGGEPGGPSVFSEEHRKNISIHRKTGKEEPCFWCGDPKWVIPSMPSKKYCSKSCMDQAQKGRAAPNRVFPPQAIEAAARKRRSQTHCKRGHPLDGDNLRITVSGRNCRTCGRMHTKAYRLKTKPPKPKNQWTHCAKGHEYTLENTVYKKDGKTRRCKTCRRETMRAWYAKRKVDSAVSSGMVST